MKKIIVIALASVLLLSGCTWGKTDTTRPNEDPYPKAPISGESTMETVGSLSISAKGTEPFWSVEVIPGESTLSVPTDSGVVMTKYKTTQDDK